MSTIEQLQTLLAQDLHALEVLRHHRWQVWSMERVVKEEHIGRCCYLAEELLGAAELQTLKQQLGLDERRWRAYKTKLSCQ